MTIPHSYTKYLIFIGIVPLVWYLGTVGHNTVIPILLAFIIFLPIVHKTVDLSDQALSYSSVLATSIYLASGVLYWHTGDTMLLLAGLIVGTLTGFWIWATWFYIDRATTLVQSDRVEEDIVGFGVVPVFTGIPLATVFLTLGTVKSNSWSLIIGILGLLISIGVLYLLLRAEQ